MRRRLLVLAPAVPPVGGVAVQTAMLLESDAMRSSFEMRTIRTNPPRPTEDPSSRKKGGLIWAAGLMARVVRTARRWRPDVVLAVLNGDSSFLRNAPAALLAGAVAGCPVHIHMHASRSGFWHHRRALSAQGCAGDPATPPDNILTRAGDRLCARLASKASSLSHLTRGIDESYVARGWPAARAVIPNMSPGPAGESPGRDGRGIAFIGRLSREKGFIDLLEALGMEPLSSAPWRLEVLGSPPGRDAQTALDRLLEAHPRRGDIRLHGIVTGEEKSRHLARCSMLVLPSHREVFPAVILEAMSCGMAVVSTAVGEIPSIMSGGGWVEVPPCRPDVLSAELERLLGDPAGTAALGAANGILARDYSVDAVSLRFSNLVMSLLEEDAAALPAPSPPSRGTGPSARVSVAALPPGSLEDVLSSFENVLLRGADPEAEFPGISRLVSDMDGPGALPSGRAGRPNPWSSEGGSILVKPNMVRHFNALPGGDPAVLTSDPRIVVPVVCMALLAVGRSGRVVVGDSPMHDCDTSEILGRWGWARITEAARTGGYDLSFADFRKRAFEIREGLVVGGRELPGDPDGYVLCDLGSKSAFEDAGIRSRSLRAATPDSRETRRHHSGGRHEYLLSGTFAKSDLVICISKLKTHNKIGITGALKNMVGLVGEKNWLPHWRTGFRGHGGDQYDRVTPASILKWAMLSAAWPFLVLKPVARAASSLAGRFHDAGVHGLSGGGMWRGNDTTWRMVCDVATAAVCCDRDGRVGDEPFPGRRILHIMDAVAAGEGEGPLAPSPVAMGMCLASTDPVALDIVACRLAGLDAGELPYIRRILDGRGVPFTALPGARVEVVDRGRVVELEELQPVCTLRPPAGWTGPGGGWDWSGGS